ncbi:MAG: hypothetical protein ACXAC0_06250, partial [Candidatus Thorarchaeota archaeon]
PIREPPLPVILRCEMFRSFDSTSSLASQSQENSPETVYIGPRQWKLSVLCTTILPTMNRLEQ